MSINNNDPDENPYTFAIQGTGTGVCAAPEIAVTGNSVNIADGDTAPDTADDTDFGSVDVTTGKVSKTFTITNSGTATLTLGASAASLSGTNASDFSITTQPSTTVGGSATTTVVVQFDPTAAGTRTATLSIANDDADEAPFDFAIQGTGTEEPGNITIVLSVVGPDTSLAFSAATTALNFTLAASGGSAQTNVTGISPGTYVVTAANLASTGYAVTAIACSDTDSTTYAIARTATLVLGSGESLTCTFTLTGPDSFTNQMIADYLGARNAMILNNQPDIERRLGHLQGSTPGDGSAGLAMFGLSGHLPSPIDLRMNGQLFAYNASARKMHEFFDSRSDQGITIPDLGKWDIWSEGRFALFRDNASQGGNFGIIHAGIDYLPTPKVLIGVKLEVDWMDQYFAATSGMVSGVGWMVGPYGTFRLDDNLYLDIGASWGQSRNSISPFGTYTDQFDTTRWMVYGSLVGEFKIESLTVSPKISAAHISEHPHAYTDSLSVPIAAQTVAQGQVEFAPRLAYDLEFGEGNRLTPWVEAGLVYAYGQTGVYSTSSYAANSLGLSGNLKAGIGWQMPGGASLDVAVQYDGIGSPNDSYGGRIGLSVPLN